MVFCSLAPSYALRGWIGMPYVLCRGDLQRPLDKVSFDTLVLCDGQTKSDAIELNDNMRHALHSFEEEGVVVFHDEPRTLQKEQYYHHYETRYFRDIIWSITGKCNYKCRHCYLDAPDAALGELPAETLFSFVDQIAECGISRVELTGGEPFARRDFWQLADRLQNRRINITMVYTNGFLLTEEVLDRFTERGIHPEFSISFDGIGWHDWMRGVKGAEDAALKALYLCQSKGFSTNVEMCVHRGNIKTLRESILKLADTGTRVIKLGSVMNTKLWLKHAEGNEMTGRAYMDAMLDYIPFFFMDGMPVNLIIGNVVKLYKGVSEYTVLAEFDEGSDQCLRRHICKAARSSCYIAPDGRLLPCMPITSFPEQDCFPKVQDTGLKQALKSSFYMQFVDRRVKDLLEACKTCRECKYHLRCGGGCRASAVAEGEKDLMGPDPFRCLMWKGGYLQKVYDVCGAAIDKYCGDRK